MDKEEAQIDVTGRFDYVQAHSGPTMAKGFRFTFFYPYSGDANLWKLRPNTWTSVLPSAEVDARRSLLILRMENTSSTSPEQLKQSLESQISSIRGYIGWQAQMVSTFNEQLPRQVRESVEHRRKDLEKLDGFAAVFDIPLVKKPGMPDFKPIEMAKKVSRPLPRVPATGVKPEPAINAEAYEEILRIIRHAGASFEGTPQTYAAIGEEGLRDNMLSHINVIFEGKATGETFRKYGKTDIRIEEDSRSAFVAECKLWGGQKLLGETLDQLLDYLTWRDCKAALVMFNKSVAGFAGTQEQVRPALTTRPGFLRELSAPAGEWRFVFQSKEDPSREITVHVFMFNLYVAPDRAGKKR
ncbi:hypothetical protein GRF61_11310 [Azoarcus sp. TTM-91]|uniref:hypothetical protein n=1 Tax=Azoarcus sp. TTM-91 TaxID=2691581 RepID=UPI00145F1EC3|nr:hypothetical protein [Azoarcus sp. TTM-91]NMG35029.1 hypothetical protein [Azoarcus sp. TTM-91]